MFNNKIKDLFEDFQYVVERKKPERICFGSTTDRDTGFVPKKINPIGPSSYDYHHLVSGTFQLLNKVRSRKGVGGLASRAPRFKRKTLMQIPSPTRYDLRKRYVDRKQYKFAAFGAKTERTFETNDIPGPGTYNAEMKKCRRTRFAHNFGRPTMIATVKVICQSRFTDKCEKCGVICKGDFWERNRINYLCHACWVEERRVRDRYSHNDLKQFKKVRTCEFKHIHNGTTAAIKLLDDSEIKKLERLENYLDLFMPC